MLLRYLGAHPNLVSARPISFSSTLDSSLGDVGWSCADVSGGGPLNLVQSRGPLGGCRVDPPDCQLNSWTRVRPPLQGDPPIQPPISSTGAPRHVAGRTCSSAAVQMKKSTTSAHVTFARLTLRCYVIRVKHMLHEYALHASVHIPSDDKLNPTHLTLPTISLGERRPCRRPVRHLCLTGSG